MFSVSLKLIGSIFQASRLVGLLLLGYANLSIAVPLLSVQTDTADLRAGPGLGYATLEVLEKGANLAPLVAEGAFIQVTVVTDEKLGGKTPAGKTGWIYAPEQGWSVQYVLSPSQIGSPVPAAAAEPGGAASASLNTGSPLAPLPPTLALSPMQGPDLAYTDLEELGLAGGHVFEGVLASHAQTFWFSLPGELKYESGQVRVHYLASSTLSDESLIRVDVNSSPRFTGKLRLDGRDNWITVPLRAGDFDVDGHLGVTIHASLVVDKSRCFGELLVPNFLHVLPDTGVLLDLPKRADSLQGGWELLPKRVRISVAKQLDEARYSNALLLGMNLVEEGKEVEFVEIPEWGDIMLAPREELAQLIYGTYHATPELRERYGPAKEYLSAGKNIQHVNLPDRGILAFTEAFEDLPAALSSWEWMNLAKDRAYRLRYANLHGDLGRNLERSEIPLRDLSRELMQVRYVAGKADWPLVLTPSQLPADAQLDRLQMSVTSAPSDAPLPPLFYVYLNDVLQQAERLSNDGTPTRFTVFLSTADQRPSQNFLRFVVQRSDQIGDCFGPLPTYPAQINADSVLIVRKAPREVEQFADLPAYFSGGLDIYLPKSTFPSSALGSLRFLSSLMYNNDYPFDHKRLHFYAPQDKLNLDKPFILVGGSGADLKAPAVAFDKGRVMVSDYMQKPILDLSDRGDIAVFQLVSSSRAEGLWIMPPEGRALNPRKPISLINDDVAFADDSGVLLSLSTQQRKISAVEYPEYEDWLDLFGKYKFWLMAAAWLLLTLVVVHLYKQASEHKRRTRPKAE